MRGYGWEEEPNGKAELRPKKKKTKMEEIGRGKAKVWLQERRADVKQEEAKAGIKMTPLPGCS